MHSHYGPIKLCPVTQQQFAHPTRQFAIGVISWTLQFPLYYGAGTAYRPEQNTVKIFRLSEEE